LCKVVGIDGCRDEGGSARSDISALQLRPRETGRHCSRPPFRCARAVHELPTQISAANESQLPPSQRKRHQMVQTHGINADERKRSTPPKNNPLLSSGTRRSSGNERGRVLLLLLLVLRSHGREELSNQDAMKMKSVSVQGRGRKGIGTKER
jgi:hypothetical protein